MEILPIPDGGIPEDTEAFHNRTIRWADALRQGKNLLIHCNAGIGRTGVVAICVLLGLHIPSDEARRIVGDAGSVPETPVQNLFLEEFERRAR